MKSKNYYIEGHWLKGDNIQRMSCQKNKTKFSVKQPDTIVIHYTGGNNGLSSAQYLCKDDIKASAHLVIDKCGIIYQLLPFDTIAWHAGVSSFNGRNNLNKYSIGIEIDNAGVLQKVGENYISWFGKKYSHNEVIEAKHRNEDLPKFWNVYNENQIDIVEKICHALLNHYPNITQILGHEEIAPGRKLDPGPAFPLDTIRERLLSGRDYAAADGNPTKAIVNVEQLNLRNMPSTKSSIVIDSLPNGSELQIHEENNGWYKVSITKTGWVNGKYIKFT